MASTAGEYKIPFLVVCDAFQSEMTAFADLILPDTTYLERHDCMSMLDRPISEFDGPVDAVRIPGACRPKATASLFRKCWWSWPGA
jgi:anaerobic selenocysteine-containing dehydrogenase